MAFLVQVLSFTMSSFGALSTSMEPLKTTLMTHSSVPHFLSDFHSWKKKHELYTSPSWLIIMAMAIKAGLGSAANMVLIVACLLYNQDVGQKTKWQTKANIVK